MVIDLDCGTIHGLILGPVLYAIYISSLFDISQLTNFADKNFAIKWNSTLEVLKLEMQRDLEMIIIWLKDLGLVVNNSKTEFCYFNKQDTPHILINLQENIIESIKQMNVLRMIFHTKLQWSPQVAQTITKG